MDMTASMMHLHRLKAYTRYVAKAPLVHCYPLLSIVHCPLKRLTRGAWLGRLPGLRASSIGDRL